MIELLVVIAIIGVLSSIVLLTTDTVRKKTRDSIRANDMQAIYTMLTEYHLQYGKIPITSSYGDANSGGWDFSSQPVGSPTFMSFLVTSGITTKVPVDPINNMTGDQSPSGTYAYKYYCYTGQGLALGYTREMSNNIVYYPMYKDPNWTCS